MNSRMPVHDMMSGWKLIGGGGCIGDPIIVAMRLVDMRHDILESQNIHFFRGLHDELAARMQREAEAKAAEKTNKRKNTKS